MSEPIRRDKEAVNWLLSEMKSMGLYQGGLDSALGPKFYAGWGSVRKAVKDSTGGVENPMQIGLGVDRPMAWGAKVSKRFRQHVVWISERLGCSPDDLMACIAWESGRTFSPSIKNMAGSGATGLIQFMPATALGLGTTVDELAKLSAEDQLYWVYQYFKPRNGKLKNLGDVYMAILWPAAIGKPDSHVLWAQDTKPTTYRQNAGLDINKDKRITRGEALAKVSAMKSEGLLPRNVNQ